MSNEISDLRKRLPTLDQINLMRRLREQAEAEDAWNARTRGARWLAVIGALIIAAGVGLTWPRALAMAGAVWLAHAITGRIFKVRWNERRRTELLREFEPLASPKGPTDAP